MDDDNDLTEKLAELDSEIRKLEQRLDHARVHSAQLQAESTVVSNAQKRP